MRNRFSRAALYLTLRGKGSAIFQRNTAKTALSCKDDEIIARGGGLPPSSNFGEASNGLAWADILLPFQGTGAR
jgi:hypothetical protein